MIGKDDYKIEIREGERYYGFYSVQTGKWISGCKKPYLLDVMNELTQRFYDLYGKEAYFKIGGYEDDSQVLRRLRNSSAGRYSD
jgi:hypothetical protein